MVQDIDRILAEVAAHAAAAGLDLETVREVLLANMPAEQHLPIEFTASRRRNPKSRRCALSQNRRAQFRVTLQLTASRVSGVSRALKNSASRLFKKVQMRGARENRRAESYLPIRCSEAIERTLRQSSGQSALAGGPFFNSLLCDIPCVT
jgi:hypothetical protein